MVTLAINLSVRPITEVEYWQILSDIRERKTKLVGPIHNIQLSEDDIDDALASLDSLEGELVAQLSQFGISQIPGVGELGYEEWFSKLLQQNMSN